MVALSVITILSVFLDIKCVAELSSMVAKRRSYMDHTFNQDTYLWILDNSTAISCLADCVKDARCCSFFYNKNTHKCQGHSLTIGTTANAINDHGSLYYVLERGENYIGDSCLASFECVTINSECRDDTCLCVPGYSFSPRTRECLPASACNGFGSEFQAVRGQYIVSNNEEDFSPITLQSCFDLCLNRTSYVCRTVEYLHSPQKCNLGIVTKLTMEQNWIVANNLNFITYYQRDCA